MPFVHCIDCGTPAMIDPSGRCPEGHTVGAAGARVAAVIGSNTPHPDEPQPWVGVVEPEAGPAATGESRAARPPSVPGTGAQAPVPPPPPEDLLRELHALGDLGAASDAAAAASEVPSTPAPPSPPAPPSIDAPSASPSLDAPSAPTPTAASSPPPLPATPEPVSASPGTPAPASSSDEASDLDALANLAAAVRTLDDRDAASPSEGSPPPPATTTEGDQPAQPETTRSSGTSDADDQASPDQPAPPLLSPFDGSFTARGDGGRGTRSGRKGLFRRG